MIARVRMLLPSYVGMQFGQEYQAFQMPLSISASANPGGEATQKRVIVHPPIRVRQEFPNPFERLTLRGDMIDTWNTVAPEHILTCHKVGGHEHWWANCFVLDFYADNFPKLQDELDYGLITVSVGILDRLLSLMRWHGNQHYILTYEAFGALTEAPGPYLVEYLTEDGQPMPKEAGYRRWDRTQADLPQKRGIVDGKPSAEGSLSPSGQNSC